MIWVEATKGMLTLENLVSPLRCDARRVLCSGALSWKDTWQTAGVRRLALDPPKSTWKL